MKRLLPLPLFALVSCTSTVPTGDTPPVAPEQVAVATVIMDDCFKSMLEWAKPILDTYNIPAAAACVTGWAEQPKNLSFADMRALQQSGWEILSHSKTHLKLSEVNDKQKRIDEVVGSQEVMRIQGIEVTSFVPPYGSDDEGIRSLYPGHYRYAFRTTSFTDMKALNESASLNTADVHRVPLDGRSFEETKAMLDLAVARHAWIVFAWHPNYDEYMKGEGQQVRRQILGRDMAYLAQLRDAGKLQVSLPKDVATR